MEEHEGSSQRMTQFRLIDLLTTLGIMILLLGVTITTRQNLQDASSIAECANNLQRIGSALSQYQEFALGEFPQTRYVPDAPITAYTGVEGSPDANDVTAAAFLLAKECNLPAKVFTCPAALRNGLAETDTFTDRALPNRNNFHARVNYNYSLVNMYPDTAATAFGYTLKNYSRNHSNNFAIAADTNPGGKHLEVATTQNNRKEIRESNSPNHQRNGQNVLFADGRVGYMPSPFSLGDFDNIYWSSGKFPQPGGKADAVLLPIWEAGPSITPEALVLRRWVLGVAIVVTIMGMAFILMNSRRKI